ncbi:MAG TPA: Gfo/Idh/MocA family oxidoreductase [Planctomycetaceae bacterium]|nr:Gfo/Idh/MocA family oxidoreductase [Planctomycetaceae bacterium]
MERATISIGVVGSGFMGRTHAEAARRAPGATLTAIAGGTRAAGLASDYEIQCEPTVSALIERNDIDAIVISTPHHLHYEAAMLAAENGKHCLVEKPLATSVEHCDEMIEAFKATQLALAVGYHQRFRQSNQTVRQLIGQGAIGKVRCIQMSALFDITALRDNEGFGGNWDWWTDPESRGHIMNSAPHNIDLCRWWIGSDVVSVAALCGTFREDNPNENTTMALWSFGDGTMASFWSSSVLPVPGFEDQDFKFRLMGDEGIIDASPFGKIRLGKEGQWEDVYQQPAVPLDDPDRAFVATERMQAYRDQMQAFVDRIRGADSICGTALDGRHAVAAIVAMLDASATEQVVRVAE